MTNEGDLSMFDSYLRKIEELQREVCDLKKRLSTTEQNIGPMKETTSLEVAPVYSDTIRFRRITMRRVGYRAVVSPDDFIAIVGETNDSLSDIPVDTLDYFRYLSRMGHEWGPLTIHTNEVRASDGWEDRICTADGFKRAIYFSKVRGLNTIPVQVFPSDTTKELLPATEEQLERIKEHGLFAFNGERTMTLKDVSIVL